MYVLIDWSVWFQARFTGRWWRWKSVTVRCRPASWRRTRLRRSWLGSNLVSSNNHSSSLMKLNSHNSLTDSFSLIYANVFVLLLDIVTTWNIMCSNENSWSQYACSSYLHLQVVFMMVVVTDGNFSEVNMYLVHFLTLASSRSSIFGFDEIWNEMKNVLTIEARFWV